MHNKRQNKLSLTLATYLLLVCTITYSTITIVHAQTINSLSSMDFGNFDFATTYSGAIQLGTNNTLTVYGSGISYGGGATRGHIRVTDPITGIIDIKCATSAQMIAAPAAPMTINAIELAITTGVAYGAGNACHGLGGGDAIAVSVDLDANPNPDIYIGAQVDLPTPIYIPSSHNYTTTGGTPIILSIVVQ